MSLVNAVVVFFHTFSQTCSYLLLYHNFVKLNERLFKFCTHLVVANVPYMPFAKKRTNSAHWFGAMHESVSISNVEKKPQKSISFAFYMHGYCLSLEHNCESKFSFEMEKLTRWYCCGALPKHTSRKSSIHFFSVVWFLFFYWDKCKNLLVIQISVVGIFRFLLCKNFQLRSLRVCVKDGDIERFFSHGLVYCHNDYYGLCNDLIVFYS